MYSIYPQSDDNQMDSGTEVTGRDYFFKTEKQNISHRQKKRKITTNSETLPK